MVSHATWYPGWHCTEQPAAADANAALRLWLQPVSGWTLLCEARAQQPYLVPVAANQPNSLPAQQTIAVHRAEERERRTALTADLLNLLQQLLLLSLLSFTLRRAPCDEKSSRRIPAALVVQTTVRPPLHVCCEH
jgi:hypothetical protein